MPPLNALKGFEAAARLLSFRKAADELNVTHVAISHQVRQLEDDLGCALFLREGRTVALTEEGRVFYDYARQALETLVTGAGIIRRHGPDADLRIETYITVAIRWLSPRLSRFHAAHPEINFSLNTRRTEWWFDETNTDVAIMYLDRDLPGSLRARTLFEGTLYPVCSPSILGDLSPVVTPADLFGLPLIEVSSAPNDWRDWFRAAGVENVPALRYTKVDTYALALEMAITGAGVAMLNGPFAEEELRRRELVLPVDLVARSRGEWAVLYRADRERDRKIRAFTDWLVADVANEHSHAGPAARGT
ncbi:LysR substrate-binding domain-containing protein [Defluviimonas sp. WL0024]|uniref:LysR substrate-binding domain-containing protein n=1 Tax=Albidovulum salinarum TaxID=2984153 RepID=A0ABT2X803_9RHOB|nr:MULTISPECIES: LysR substrate-binding domain-containing protein [Defluviimonas]MCU9850083.1 LysR substrate-binding domain-containing protein [Defluviimonas sp. WL0024]